MLSDIAIAKLERILKPPEGSKLYGIIDGASVPDFLYLAEESSGQHECLFAGELAPDVERAAPHLIELESESELMDRWLKEGWGQHWGIMMHLPEELTFKAVRRHFRKFLRVKLPDKSYVLFRYYDPRVLRSYLPTCTASEAETIFGAVTSYFAEDKDTGIILYFTQQEGVLVKRLPLPTKPKAKGAKRQ